MIMETSLEKRVNEVTLFLNSVLDKIGGDAPGVLEDLLEPIRRVLETVLGKIKDALGDLISGITDTISDLIDNVKELIESFNAILEDIIAGILDRIGTFFDGIITTFKDILRSITDVISDIISEVKKFLMDHVGEIIKIFRDALRDFSGWIAGIIEALKSKLFEIGKNILEFAKKIWESVSTIVSNIAKTIKEGAIELAEKIKAWLRDLLHRLVELVGELVGKLGKAIDNAFELILSKIFGPFDKNIESAKEVLLFKGEVLAKCATGQYDDLGKFLDDLKDPPGIPVFLSMAISALFLAPIVIPTLSGVVAPAIENLIQLSRKFFAPMLLDKETVLNAYFRRLVDDKFVLNEFERMGYKPEKVRIMVNASAPLLSPGALQEAFLRGEITEADHDAGLMMHGYTSNDIKLFKALYWIIPPTSDLIRMAVREAFSPAIAEKFGQYEDFPDEFAEWAEKQGLTRDWAKRYWAAHWDLPSPQMGFEMLHRGIISKEELKLLLRALDVMPFWREKLIQLSYAPYTRVDLRRMYQLGILDEAGVTRAYMDLGYDSEKAAALTRFTTEYYSAEDKTELDEYRGLTRTIYITAYKKGVITRGAAKNYLIGIGYREDDAELLLAIADAEMIVDVSQEDILPKRSDTLKRILDAYKRGVYSRQEAKDALDSLRYSDDEIEYYLNLADYELELAVKSAILETIKELYVTRTIEKPDLVSYLSRIFISSGEMNRILDIWDTQREMRVKKPTEAQFRYALQHGLITVEDYENELRGLGYAEKYIPLLSRMATGK